MVRKSLVKLSLKNTRPTYICGFYRPPDGSIPNFIDSLNDQLNQIVDNPTSDVVMLGDANIDLLKHNKDSQLLRNFGSKFPKIT